MNANDIEIALRARAAFNDSVDSVDADTRRRLRDLRLYALHPNRRPARALWVWPTGVALTAALALAVFLPRIPHAPPAAAAAIPMATATGVQPAAIPASATQAFATTATQIASSDPVEAAADPDMLSDLDFYGWLAKQPGSSGKGG